MVTRMDLPAISWAFAFFGLTWVCEYKQLAGLLGVSEAVDFHALIIILGGKCDRVCLGPCSCRAAKQHEAGKEAHFGCIGCTSYTLNPNRKRYGPLELPYHKQTPTTVPELNL